MNVLNLYSGLGGNRKKWANCNIISIENNKEIAGLYKKLFPDDTVIVCDAHEYLKNHFKEYDFIWSSPPCQSHSSFRQNIGVRYRGVNPVYPDMRLYQEIIFLRYNYKGFWVVENVNPYYEPLIKPNKKIGRHLFWTNITIDDYQPVKSNIRKHQIADLQKLHDINLDNYKIKNKRQILRNCIDYKIGEHIFNSIKKNQE